MTYDQTLARIQGSRTGTRLDEISRALWTQAHDLSDNQAQSLAEAIQARRRSLVVGQGAPPRGNQKARCRSASLMRRRQLAASGVMPPALAAHFTTAELAALRIVSDEIRTNGICGLVLDAIAARAGVSKRSVQNALREAERLGFLTIRHRRIRGQLKNLPNLISILSPEWLTWLKVAKDSSPRIDRSISDRKTQHAQVHRVFRTIRTRSRHCRDRSRDA